MLLASLFYLLQPAYALPSNNCCKLFKNDLTIDDCVKIDVDILYCSKAMTLEIGENETYNIQGVFSADYHNLSLTHVEFVVNVSKPLVTEVLKKILLKLSANNFIYGSIIWDSEKDIAIDGAAYHFDVMSNKGNGYSVEVSNFKGIYSIKISSW